MNLLRLSEVFKNNNVAARRHMQTIIDVTANMASAAISAQTSEKWSDNRNDNTFNKGCRHQLV